ncbi:MAG: Thymidylate kinase [Cirrosporium novae-zelandiae]|nr:MAG: Thymidylate kinase [Cirrosporium novae-zelandiae]
MSSQFENNQINHSETSTVSRGALIVIEGLDRAGKSTQVKELAKVIDGVAMRFPDRTTYIGEVINKYLKGVDHVDDHAIHLLFSANRWERLSRILDLINAGTHVVVDRYSYSGAVYSAAKQNPRLSLQWAWQPEVGLPKPDLCIFLDISPEAAAKRGGFGDEKYENNKMQQEVRRLFNTLVRMPENDEMKVIDAGRPWEDVNMDVLAAAKNCISSIQGNLILRKFGPLNTKGGDTSDPSKTFG